MMRNKERKLGLYIHIPFCVRKCGYCDFLSAPASEEERERYVSSLVREMELWGELGLRGDVERCKELGLRGDVERCKEPGLRGNMEQWREAVSDYEVDTVFIGGGTPSVLSAAQMDRVFQGIADHFPLGENPEFTVECNPGTVTAEKLAAYRRAGVNRISFGMQSAHDEELFRLGRIHTFRDFETSYEQARKAGFSNINIDVMAAIPGQTEKSYEETLLKVISLAPEHISSYSLIIEEGTPFYEKYAENPPVDEETDRQMYEMTGELLAGAGYGRYEISNYAREGFSCRHNLKYWRREEYLGLGLGAASFVGRCRFSNERETPLYEKSVGAGRLPVAEREELSADDEQAEFMYLGLRCMSGVSKKDFCDCFGVELAERYGGVIEKWKAGGFLAEKDGRIFLTGRGIDVSNRIFADFL